MSERIFKINPDFQQDVAAEGTHLVVEA